MKSSDCGTTVYYESVCNRIEWFRPEQGSIWLQYRFPESRAQSRHHRRRRIDDFFGLAEIVTGFTHYFFGITTPAASALTCSAVLIAAFYAAAGMLILTMKRWAAVLSIVQLGADIAGRIFLVAIGLYPTDTLENTLSIVAGTVVVGIVAIFIWLKQGSFR